MSVDFGINYNLNSDVDISSWQESNLDVYKLDEIVEQSKAANTKKCTSWGITKLRKWAMKRNISINFKDVSPDSLNDILRKFYAEVKTEKKQMLSPSALINWYPCCNISDLDFTTVLTKYEYYQWWWVYYFQSNVYSKMHCAINFYGFNGQSQLWDVKIFKCFVISCCT